MLQLPQGGPSGTGTSGRWLLGQSVSEQSQARRVGRPRVSFGTAESSCCSNLIFQRLNFSPDILSPGGAHAPFTALPQEAERSEPPPRPAGAALTWRGRAGQEGRLSDAIPPRLARAGGASAGSSGGRGGRRRRETGAPRQRDGGGAGAAMEPHGEPGRAALSGGRPEPPVTALPAVVALTPLFARRWAGLGCGGPRLLVAVAAVGWVGVAGSSRGVSGGGLLVWKCGTGAGVPGRGRVQRAEVRYAGLPKERDGNFRGVSGWLASNRCRERRSGSRLRYIYIYIYACVCVCNYLFGLFLKSKANLAVLPEGPAGVSPGASLDAGRAGSVAVRATPEVRTEPQDACAVPNHAAAFPGRGGGGLGWAVCVPGLWRCPRGGVRREAAARSAGPASILPGALLTRRPRSVCGCGNDWSLQRALPNCSLVPCLSPLYTQTSKPCSRGLANGNRSARKQPSCWLVVNLIPTAVCKCMP